MKTTLALCLVFVSTTLFAQYGPPAKDLDEAQFFMREIQRQLEPAMNEVRDRAAVFATVARAHNRLVGKEPASEISDAMKIVDDFVDRRRRSGKELSRENQKTLDSVHKELELAQPPYAIAALRERLHHEFVHPLERQVLKDMGDLERLKQLGEAFVARFIAPTVQEGMAGLTIAAKEPGQ